MLPGGDFIGSGNCGICGPHGHSCWLPKFAFTSVHPLRLGRQGLGAGSTVGKTRHRIHTKMEIAMVFAHDLCLWDMFGVFTAEGAGQKW